MNQNYPTGGSSIQGPIQEPKKSKAWLWITFAVVIIAAGIYFGRQYLGQGKVTPTPTATPTATSTVADETSQDLKEIETSLNKLETNFSDLQKVDASEDEAPSL